MDTNIATISRLSAGNYTYTCSPNVTVNGGTGTAMPTADTAVTIKGKLNYSVQYRYVISCTVKHF